MTDASKDAKSGLTHLREDGAAHMVDVGDKVVTTRQAIAQGQIVMTPHTLDAIMQGNIKKGDVFATARIAAIMAAKKTGSLIPLCHPLALTHIDIEIEADASLPGIHVSAKVRVDGKTGVEMEALTAVSVACLTIYDMAKALQKDMVIGPIRLIEKTGGKSGDFGAKN